MISRVTKSGEQQRGDAIAVELEIFLASGNCSAKKGNFTYFESILQQMG